MDQANPTPPPAEGWQQRGDEQPEPTLAELWERLRKHNEAVGEHLAVLRGSGGSGGSGESGEVTP